MEIARLLYRFWVKQEKFKAPKRALTDPEEDRPPKETLEEGITINPSQTLERETVDRNEENFDGPPPSPTIDDDSDLASEARTVRSFDPTQKWSIAAFPELSILDDVRKEQLKYTRHHQQNAWSPLVKLEGPPIWERQMTCGTAERLTLTNHTETYGLRARPYAPREHAKTPQASLATAHYRYPPM